jgi:hypothetical protein
LHSMGHEKHGVTVFGEGLRALSVRMLPRSTEQGEARSRLPAGTPVPVTHHRHRSAGKAVLEGEACKAFVLGITTGWETLEKAAEQASIL